MSDSYFTGASQQYKQNLQDTEARGSDSELKELRARSRWMIANNGYAASALLKSVSNWVGRGIIGTWDDPELQKHWESFTKSPMLNGIGTFNSYQSLLANSVFADGELFIRVHLENEDATIPFSLEAISARHCPVREEDGIEGANDGRAGLGILYNQRTGRPARYRFHNYMKEDKDSRFSWMEYKLVSVPAENVLHTFESRYANQRRGLPTLTPAILPLWELQDLTDATITRQQAAQAVGWVVEQEDETKAFPALGTAVTVPTAGTGVIQSGWGVTPPPSTTQPILETITSGGVHYLRKGEKVKFAEIPDIGRNLPILLNHLLRKLAAGCGLMYEQLTGDLSDVNYSSIRAGRIDFLARVEQVRELVIIEGNLNRVANRFKVAASNWTGKDFSGAEINWIAPRTYGIDPLKDAKMDQMELEGDRPLSTWSDKLNTQGKTFEAHTTQLDKEDEYVLKRNAKINRAAPNQGSQAGGDSKRNTSKTPKAKG